MRRNSLTILSVTVVLLFTVQDYSIAATDDFTLFVNNSSTKSGSPVHVPSGSIVYFEIQQSSNLPVHFDPTGKGEVGYPLSGNLARFSTVYNAGKYSPVIKVGDRTKTLQLVVDQGKVDSVGWLNVIPQVSWPLLILGIFLVLFCWPGFRTFVLNINEVEIAGVKMKASDLSSKINAKLKGTIDTINIKLPQTPGRFLPSSLSYDIARHVHFIEFIDDIAVHPLDVNALNAVGNYYFVHDSTKAEIAYSRAIEQDKDDPNAYANLGMLYFMRKRDSHAAKQYFTTALKLAEKVGTPCASAHMGMVAIYHNARDMDNEKLHCEQAKNIFHKSVSIDSSDFWSLCFLGWCWSYGDYNLNKAIEYTLHALKYAPDFLGAWYNLACFYALQNDPQNSIEALKQIVPFLEQVLRQRDKGDLIYIDFTDPEDAPCLSMFDVKLSDDPREKERVLLGTLELYKYVFSALIGAVLTPRQTTLLSYLSELMIATDGANLRTMKDVLWDATPFTRDMRKLRKDAADFFSMEFQTKEWGEVKKQLLDRLNAILGNTVLMRIFTQPKSKIDLYKAINTGKTIVVNTSVNHLQSEGTSILGRFFIAMLFQAALRRTGQPGSNKPAFLYLDEAWQYLDDKLPELYNMARKYDLGLVLASQQITHFSSKSMTLRNAAFSSAILFGGRVSNKEDKELIAECGMLKESTTSMLTQEQDATGKPLSSEFYCRIEGKGGQRVKIPFYTMENAPQLSDSEYKEMLEENRQRFTEPVRAPRTRPTGVPKDVDEVVEVEGGQLLRKPKDKRAPDESFFD